MITIRRYQPQDLLPIEAITRRAFTLTSFDVDPLIPTGVSAEVAWEIWARPILEKNGENACLCAIDEENNILVGFLIYGEHKQFSELIGKKISSIIIMGIDPDRGMGQHIGSQLVSECVKLMEKRDVNLISVGTDLNNYAAIGAYQKNEFRSIMHWGNWRFYTATHLIPS